MRQRQTNRFARSKLAAIAAVLMATVACGAAVPKAGRQRKDQAPMTPVAYDPRVSLSPLVEKVSGAVVNIRAVAKTTRTQGMFPPDSLFEWFFGPRGPGERPFSRRFPEREPEQRSLGSGFIIDAEGLVVTNHHVVAQADEIEVQLGDDRTFEAEVVGSDERTDVALLRLTRAKKLPTVCWGRSDDIEVGDHVVAIGNPFGLDHTVTAGIVSAKERVIGAGPYDDFIQTDASINPGNSGGPLFNLKGEVIGIATAINPQGQGIGFAIPSDLARTVIDSLISKGKVVRGWLGVTFQPLDEDLAEAFHIGHQDGVVVTDVTPDSPADKAGVKTEDVIVEIAGHELKDPRHLPFLVAGLEPGEVARIKVIRDGKPKTLEIRIGEMPAELAGASSGEKLATKLGFEVGPLSDKLRGELGADDMQGVVVTRISPESPAAGVLRTGDIIVSVNKKEVPTVEQFASVTESLGSGDNLLLRVFRRGGWVYLILKL